MLAVTSLAGCVGLRLTGEAALLNVCRPNTRPAG